MYNFKSKEDLIQFLQSELINTNNAVDILGCTRQNIDDLVKRNKLTPIRTFPRDRIFLRSDVLARVK